MKSIACCAVVFLLVVVHSSPLLADEKKPIIVASTTQIADFARQIVGDRMVVKSVLALDADPHTYQ